MGEDALSGHVYPGPRPRLRRKGLSAAIQEPAELVVVADRGVGLPSSDAPRMGAPMTANEWQSSARRPCRPDPGCPSRSSTGQHDKLAEVVVVLNQKVE